MRKFTVVLDACTLYPAPLRNMLMHLIMTGLFQGRWSNQIHDEWIRNLLIKRPDISEEKLERVRFLMDSHVPDCLVTGHECLISGLDLPDVDDRHVLAAAIKSNAEHIITFNLKDFPDDYLNKFGISAVHPDDFLSDMYELSPNKCLEAISKYMSQNKNPKLTYQEMIEMLEKQGLVRFASKMISFRAIFE
ncbi:hypothetical protein CZ809_03847 [Photobacterium piscicola]|uniref:Uncharacterized protein n=1 Tax=Photobacterium piscicola TaxID=1378299 RepID=A0A1T5I5U2_9GAMM|nr:PIN domain-containing protein [Photobacterium piscicola]SKC34235.1 hypothetical protein CZ809_03847 [Photobacterium piscicola]